MLRVEQQQAALAGEAFDGQQHLVVAGLVQPHLDVVGGDVQGSVHPRGVGAGGLVRVGGGECPVEGQDAPVRATGVIVALAGLAGLLVCFADFVLARGTPAPVAPTERLVVEGPYRFVRNPMYVAGVTIVMGQALWWGSPWVAAYGVLVWATTATFVRIYEEPTLRRTYGASYEAYAAAVRRWIPRIRPWRSLRR